MKENPRQQFRWAPHTIGATTVRPKDFDPSETIEATGFYDAWSRLQESTQPLEVGDILESPEGDLRICKYVGMEVANWVVPEPQTAS